MLLYPESAINEVSVASKMSWMAGRSTTRIEDEAYCLLGLFNLNMPLLYGEGERAFFRLQSEILRVSADESIFCSRVRDFTLLASTPRDYSNAIKLSVDENRSIGRAPYSATNQGLRFEITPDLDTHIGSYSDSKAPDWILIGLDVLMVPKNQLGGELEDRFRSLRMADRAAVSLAGRFLYVQRLTCGHYGRRPISQSTIDRVLSKDRMGRNLPGVTSSRNQRGAHSPRGGDDAARSESHLVIYIHFDQSQLCNGLGHEMFFGGSIEGKIERLSGNLYRCD